MAETPTAPVFRQMRTGVVFLGMRPADWGKLAALGVLCLALFYATGLITVNATVERHSYDITDEVVEYRAARDAAAQARDAMKKYGAQDISEIDLPASTREEAEKAAELGIGPDASDEEVAAMVPADSSREGPARRRRLARAVLGRASGRGVPHASFRGGLRHEHDARMLAIRPLPARAARLHLRHGPAFRGGPPCLGMPKKTDAARASSRPCRWLTSSATWQS